MKSCDLMPASSSLRKAITRVSALGSKITRPANSVQTFLDQSTYSHLQNRLRPLSPKKILSTDHISLFWREEMTGRSCTAGLACKDHLYKPGHFLAEPFLAKWQHEQSRNSSDLALSSISSKWLSITHNGAESCTVPACADSRHDYQ